MRIRAVVSTLVFVLVLFTMASVMFAAAPQQIGGHRLDGRQQDLPLDPSLEKKLAKQRTKDRYQSLRRDSEKLLELATELKQHVDRAGENTLSMDVIKKCDDIEKLSKSIRGKMKGD